MTTEDEFKDKIMDLVDCFIFNPEQSLEENLNNFGQLITEDIKN